MTPPATSYKSPTARRVAALVRKFFSDPEVIEEIVDEGTRLDASGGTGKLLVTVDLKDGRAATFLAVAVPSTHALARRPRRMLVLDEGAGR